MNFNYRTSFPALSVKVIIPYIMATKTDFELLLHTVILPYNSNEISHCNPDVRFHYVSTFDVLKFNVGYNKSSKCEHRMILITTWHSGIQISLSVVNMTSFFYGGCMYGGIGLQYFDETYKLDGSFLLNNRIRKYFKRQQIYLCDSMEKTMYANDKIKLTSNQLVVRLYTLLNVFEAKIILTIKLTKCVPLYSPHYLILNSPMIHHKSDRIYHNIDGSDPFEHRVYEKGGLLKVANLILHPEEIPCRSVHVFPCAWQFNEICENYKHYIIQIRPHEYLSGASHSFSIEYFNSHSASKYKKYTFAFLSNLQTGTCKLMTGAGPIEHTHVSIYTILELWEQNPWQNYVINMEFEHIWMTSQITAEPRTQDMSSLVMTVSKKMDVNIFIPPAPLNQSFSHFKILSCHNMFRVCYTSDRDHENCTTFYEDRLKLQQKCKNSNEDSSMKTFKITNACSNANNFYFNSIIDSYEFNKRNQDDFAYNWVDSTITIERRKKKLTIKGTCEIRLDIVANIFSVDIWHHSVVPVRFITYNVRFYLQTIFDTP